jgi:hypothetical protein
MKIFIWENVSHVSDSYHGGGGVAVVAATLERARELLPSPKPYGEDVKRCEAHDVAPTATYETTASEERVFVFPDAGCC